MGLYQQHHHFAVSLRFWGLTSGSTEDSWGYILDCFHPDQASRASSRFAPGSLGCRPEKSGYRTARLATLCCLQHRLRIWGWSVSRLATLGYTQATLGCKRAMSGCIAAKSASISAKWRCLVRDAPATLGYSSATLDCSLAKLGSKTVR